VSSITSKYKLDAEHLWRNRLAIHLEEKDLVNAQQLEVAVNGPDGATHLILCTGIVEFDPTSFHGTYTFPVGP